MSRVRIKICGLTRPVDAENAAAAGADYLGCVLVPSSPRAVDPERARTISAAAPGVPLVLVVAGLEPAELEASARVAGASVLQLHGDETPDLVRALRSRGPWGVWKGVRVRDAASAREALDRWLGIVDGVLLDGWAPHQLGGTGTPFPWEEVAPLRPAVPEGTLLIAAGGLNPENVGRAVSLLRPDVVDVSSGVESTPGVKDPTRVRDFVLRARTPTSTLDP